MPRRMNRYPRFGEKMNHLVRALAVSKGWNMRQTVIHIAEAVNYYGPDCFQGFRHLVDEIGYVVSGSGVRVRPGDSVLA